MRIAILLATLIATIFTTATLARQRAEGGHVVHSRRAPVALHRAVPPFKGVHVYQGRQR
jgi:hypothetical protein